MNPAASGTSARIVAIAVIRIGRIRVWRGLGRCGRGHARNDGCTANTNDQVLDLIDRSELADRRDRDLLALDRKLAAGKRQIVGLQDADDLLRRDAGLAEQLGVEGNDELVLEPAGEVGAGDAGQRLELGDDLGPGDLGDGLEVGVPPAAETEATTTGAELKLKAPTVGSTPFGRPALRRFPSIDATASSRSAA